MAVGNQDESKNLIAMSDKHKYKFAVPHQQWSPLIMSKEFSKGKNISQKAKVYIFHITIKR